MLNLKNLEFYLKLNFFRHFVLNNLFKHLFFCFFIFDFDEAINLKNLQDLAPL